MFLPEIEFGPLIMGASEFVAISGVNEVSSIVIVLVVANKLVFSSSE